MIALDSNTYFQLGRKAVLDVQYDKAVGYFIRSGDYNAQLTAVVLLFYMGELYLAHQQYVKLFVQFDATHNVNADLMWAMRGGGEKLYRRYMLGKFRKRDKLKKSATRSKVFQYGFLKGLSFADCKSGEKGT